MANFIRFTDTVEFNALSIQTQRKDHVNANDSSPLYVKIAATHSGLVTRNNGFYLPDRMQKGAPSFTAHYGKPIQVHHDDARDPIGRVVKATYVDTSAMIHDKFIQRVLNTFRAGTYSDAFMKDFLKGKTSFIQSINFISDALNIKDSVLDDPSYQGLGYIQLDAVITDPEAKQKILDGRYLTGSVGATTNRAVCSVCKQDWTSEDGRCDHRPGKVYDGAKAFIIAGDLTYDEYSLVNVPADRHSRIMEVNINGISDSLVMDSSVGRTISVDIRTDNVDRDKTKAIMDSTSQEELMDKEKIEQLIATLKGKFSLLDANDSVDKFLVDLVGADELDATVALEAFMDTCSVTKIFAIEDSSKKLEALKTLRPFMHEDGLTKVSTEKYATAEELIVALDALEWADYSETEDEALVAYLAEHPEDSKLSASQRKRLPGSSFCGPNKSFPVPDCAHVAAARKLIGRASVSGATKSKILACVSRKSTAMSCGTKDSVADNTSKESTNTNMLTIAIDKYEGPIDLFTLLAKDSTVTISGPGTLVLELPIVADLSNKLQAAIDAVSAHDALVKELADLKAEKGTFSKTLDAVQTELKLAHDDLVQMSDRLVTQEESLLKEKAIRLVDYRILSGEKVEDKTQAINTVITLGQDAVDKQFNEITTKVDMNKIADSINSGLTRTVVGSVTDPTLQLNENKQILDKTKIKAVEEEFMRIQFGGYNPMYGRGAEAANKFRKDMQLKGLLPQGN